MKKLLVALTAALALSAAPASAQVTAPGNPMIGAEETKTVSSTTLGVTADLCGVGNIEGVLAQVISANGIYLAIHSPTATADSGDFPVLQYGTFYVKPASLVRMIRSTGTDASVKIQCVK